jgi:rubrerythrin
MKKEKELDKFDLKQLIGYSVDSEEQSRQFYGEFVESGKGQLVPERFRSLMNDEKLHKETLLGLYEELYGDRDYAVPQGEGLPPHEDFESLEDVGNLIDALEKAIVNENNAIRIYKYMENEYGEYSDLFGYLVSMEKGHLESLKEEKKLYERKAESPEKNGLLKDFWENTGLKGW